MARISSGSAVAGLTAAALTAVCVLAYQASGSTPDRPGPVASKRPAASAPAGKSPGPRTHPVPARSGTGKRVVYAPEEKRVWLVGADRRATRSFRVVPSSVSPSPGTYRVVRRSERTVGSDGVPVEHVVVFGSVGPTVIGFSAAVDGSLPEAGPSRKTGGIRQTREDGAAMWRFAVLGVKVVVVG